MKRKIYKTVLRIEVLSPEPIDESATVEDLLYECDKGECSGFYETEQLNKVLNGKKAINEIQKHGSDPQFFMMDEEGNEILD